METTEFLSISPVEDDALKGAWVDYFACSCAHGEEIKDSVSAALCQMSALFQYRGRLFFNPMGTD